MGGTERVFAPVRFYIAENVDPVRAEELRESLLRHGATEFRGDLGDREAFEHSVTHVVAESSQCAAAAMCQDLHADAFPVRDATRPCAVTPQWVVRSLALGQMQPEVVYSADPGMIFSGVVICCARLSPHDTELLSAAVVAYGGAYKLTLCEEVTHLVAVSRESAKVRALEAHPDVAISVVAPQWISDSFSLGRRLPLDSYAFDLHKPDALPPCLLPSSQRPPPPAPAAPAPQPRTAHATPVLAGKTVLLARDVHGGALESQPELHFLEQRVAAAGGRCVPAPAPDASDADTGAAVRAADIVVTRFRETPEFRHALVQGKTVGTLSWLARVLSSGHLTSPRDRLLHFPCPQEPVAGFPEESITITNYTGAQRHYLKDLLARMGGSFTPELTPQNTVVVALCLTGDKVAKAREWNIPIVNHVWLESCFATWTKQTLAQRQFITFPGRAELEAVVGHAAVADSSVAAWLPGEATPPIPSQGTPEAEPAADAEAAETSAVGGRAEPAAEPAAGERADGQTEPAAPADGPAEPNGTSPAEPAEPASAPTSEARAQPQDASQNAADAAQVAASLRTPPKRKHAAKDTPSRTPASSRKRSRGAEEAVRIATTSVELSKPEWDTLEALGVQRTDQIAAATHLVAHGLTRTEKMLCAIASGTVQIVSRAWVADMVKRKEVLDAAPYILRDRKKEQQWQMDLRSVLARSAEHPGALLRGHTFFLTRSVQPSREILRHVVEAAGGSVASASGSGAARALAGDPEHVHLVSCAEDSKALAALRQQHARTSDAPLPVWTPEVILSGVLRQELHFGPEVALDE